MNNAAVLVATSKINQYGFLPKIGQWIRVKGTLSNGKEGLYDASFRKKIFLYLWYQKWRVQISKTLVMFVPSAKDLNIDFFFFGY